MFNKEPMIVHCSKCGHEWAPCFMPISATVMAKVCGPKTRCPACGGARIMLGPHPRETPVGEFEQWLRNGDTGESSKTIWSVLAGQRPAKLSPDVPHDPADFGRCYRLLKVMPAWRARLSEVADRFPQWKPFVEAWDELTALYEEELPSGKAPKLFERIRSLKETVPS